MLDAYIIERIRRQREERRDGDFQQIRIDVPQEPPHPPRPEREPGRDEHTPDGGAVIIDFLF